MVRVLTKISLLKTFRIKTNNFHKNGFTLMEVMIVLAIMAAIVGLAIPKINNRNNQIKSEVRRLTTLSRQVRHLAKMQNSTFRLVIDMKEGSSSDDEHTYWIEKATGNVLLSEEREDQYIQSLDKISEEKDEDDEKSPPATFTPDTSVLKKAKTLPGKMIFESVEIPGFEKPLSSGKIYIHFFPSGRVEEAAIHLKLDEIQWTLAIHPLTGKTDIIGKYLSLKDLLDQ